jgi:hypothetical protein
MDAIVMNWQTTLAGAIAALGAYLTTLADPYHTIGVILSALGLAGLGLAAKQHNVTGGTIAATAEAGKRVSPLTSGGVSVSQAPKGYARLSLLAWLGFAAFALALVTVASCAALSRTTIDTGDMDLGKGVTCRTTTAPTDAANCSKLVTQSCAFPLPKAADGTCPLDAIAIDIPFKPGKNAQCQVSAGIGSVPCTKLVATSCTLAIPRDAAGACP